MAPLSPRPDSGIIPRDLAIIPPSPRPPLPHRERIRLARGPWRYLPISGVWSRRFVAETPISLVAPCTAAVVFAVTPARPVQLASRRAATDQRLILFYLLVGRTARHGIVCEMHASVCPCV
jgi:hypothetical protein